MQSKPTTGNGNNSTNPVNKKQPALPTNLLTQLHTAMIKAGLYAELTDGEEDINCTVMQFLDDNNQRWNIEFSFKEDKNTLENMAVYVEPVVYGKPKTLFQSN